MFLISNEFLKLHTLVPSPSLCRLERALLSPLIPVSCPQTHISRKSCMPFILCMTLSMFLRLRKGFHGGSLGKSLETFTTFKSINKLKIIILINN